MTYLYHGVLQDNIDSMLSEGIRPNSYWGSIEEAANYTDCDKVIRINADDYSVLVNETILNHYQDHDEDSECLIDWDESKKTWQDSLQIFGTVIVEDVVHFTKDDIVNIKDL